MKLNFQKNNLKQLWMHFVKRPNSIQNDAKKHTKTEFDNNKLNSDLFLIKQWKNTKLKISNNVLIDSSQMSSF